MGNIIGGVDPFEGTDLKLEDRPNLDEEEVKNSSFHDMYSGVTCILPPISIYSSTGVVCASISLQLFIVRPSIVKQELPLYVCFRIFPRSLEKYQGWMILPTHPGG